ncbi:MAG TPA: phage holin family protein [Acetobacteraceae bacterium]|nr:phage holin family protein [Acetobacteraceae bacterium]
MDDVTSSRSLRDVVGDVAHDAQELVRGELALARAELDRKIDRAVMALVWVFGGMFVGFAGLIILLLAGVAALEYVIKPWAAYLVIGAIVAVIGGLLTRSGITMLSIDKLAPYRTARNLRADAQVVKGHV